MSNEQSPIMLGEQANSNTQQLENPNLSGSIIPSNFMDMLTPEAKEMVMEQSLIANREQLRQEIIEKGKTELSDEDATMFKAPKPGCKKCHGTGREGWYSTTAEVKLCDCMRRGKLLDSSPDEFISVGDFLKIYSVEKPTYPRSHIKPKSIRKVVSKNKKLIKKGRKRERLQSFVSQCYPGSAVLNDIEQGVLQGFHKEN